MSVRLRLSLWFGWLTGGVVVLVCLYSYAVHSRVHYDELDRSLQRAAEHVTEELNSTPPTRHAEVLAASQHLGTAIRLFDEAGRLIRESQNAERLPAVDARHVFASAGRRAYPEIARLAPSFYPGGSAVGAFDLLRDGAGKRWRVLVARNNSSQTYIAVLQPMAAIDESVSRFGRLMVLMSIVGGLLTFGAGWIVAGRALRPVTLLTSAARSIARSQAFAQRVPVARATDELGQLATTFNEMLGSLESAYSAQQRFVSDASHELRAPLTIVKANLELLSRHAHITPSELRPALTEASFEAERLHRLVVDLLVLARADAGQKVRRMSVELDRVLMDVLGEARHLTAGQRLVVDSIEPVQVIGDADHLKQLILILVENAIKFTPPPGRILLTLERSGDSARLAVRDTGAGIPVDALPHVFERFYRANIARSRDPGGTGLGLAIARWIVGQHGGSIAIDSTVGQGTRVVVDLPTT